jgi:hypothetical protein
MSRTRFHPRARVCTTITPLLAILALLALGACADGATAPSGGGGGGTDPTPTAPISDQAYAVSVTNPQYQCQVTADPGSFDFSVFVHQASPTSYGVYYITDGALNGALAGDLFSLSPVTIQLDNGTVTLSGKWTFSEDRRSFSGSTTFDVHRNDGAACQFVFATSGAHAGLPSVVLNDPRSAMDLASSSLSMGAAQVFPAHSSGADCVSGGLGYEVFASPTQFEKDAGGGILTISPQGGFLADQEWLIFSAVVGWYDANGAWQQTRVDADGASELAKDHFYSNENGFYPLYKWSPSAPGNEYGWVRWDILGSNAHGDPEPQMVHVFVPGPGTYWYAGVYTWLGIPNLGVPASFTTDEWKQIACR